ncbi:DUF2567 domain-containing protein [Amycolatopsis endophytica]|uniref:Xanthosine utilization system XapX-like protein n=1 Tax=Amycolatopsis endophytica TaxID=860233 RepID=A0A853B6B2_9PSEU|nr:DUF2567 domain-containing protein [Amycolatopsis endophytica]NYI90307.1 xanthosine utilization system XapX-like protein [Amycolatopsis endophytica]
MADSSPVRTTPGARGPELPAVLFTRRPPRPRVIVKADLLPAVSVLSLIGVVGIPLGWLWSRLAPAEHVRVFDAGQLIPLQLESWHRFDGLAVYALLGFAAGLVTGVGVWMLRERRGPVVLVAAVLGGLLAAWLGTQIGVAFANSHYAVTTTPAVGDVIARAPRIESMWVLVTQPLATALVYGLLAGWNGRDDLGRRLG